MAKGITKLSNKLFAFSVGLAFLLLLFPVTGRAAAKSNSEISGAKQLHSGIFSVYYGESGDFFLFKDIKPVKKVSDNTDDKKKDKEDPYDGSETRTSRKGANGDDSQ